MPRDPYKLYWYDYVAKYTAVPLVPHFVKPNHITVFRFIATPFVVLFLITGNYAVGVPLFLFVAATDALDGSVARLRRQITQWGTFYDPVADKILIGSVVLIIVMKHINVWFGLIILAIEMLIALGGFLRRKKAGIVTSANMYGKIKMFFQVAGVTILLFAVWLGIDLFIPISVGTLSLGIVFAIISLYTYSL